MATYTLMCAVRDNEYFASYSIATPSWKVVEEMRMKIEKEFVQLSPVVREDFVRMNRHREQRC